MYWPSTSSNGEFFCKNKDGKLLDPDEYLGRYADWQDAATWPVSSRQSVAPDVAHVKKQADPRGKTGVVGAFCRTYTITDAIEAFLAGVYASTGDACRFDYIPADSSAGVVVYDDLFAYSHHATDPACGQLLNAFDLVRTHLFAHMDENQPADTPVSQLGSYQAMSQLVLDDARVKITLAEEKRAQAQADFNSTSNSGSEDDGAEDTQDAASGTDWRSKLEYERRTMVLKNTLGNLTLILENDEQLRSIVFNQQADGLEITGKVPWPHPSRFWRDQDDAQLVCYIDSTYGTFSQRNYQIAMTKVTDDRSYHPIRDYLSSLPAWDGVERVDTLLVDYLGAKDSAYTRAVTRKTLCAAIKRVQEPGCKFDSMLVLNGPQGIGKSTLIAKLAGQWFSDSLNLSDTKDKTAAEKLQGYWILEIGELAGLRKAEVETLRSFLSRQNDIYRAAYGRHATPHARQCVFFGTTNAESGYLRDTTGNRRFWPVHTPGGAPYSSWDITQAQVDQVWAEALTYVKAGETLYLQADLEYAAQNQQREAMETDDREGLIHAYLDTLLPENWDEMDLYTRRNFLDASNEFDTSTRSGTVRRESVSNIEIWCECLGKNRADITSVESNRIRAVLIKAGWVRSPHKNGYPSTARNGSTRPLGTSGHSPLAIFPTKEPFHLQLVPHTIAVEQAEWNTLKTLIEQEKGLLLFHCSMNIPVNKRIGR
ncbi:virulence-associated E family protein [Arcanobacterium hippocoleae]|uniref:virulence-associated E family protein n=1 Tax=Arcanobacterium hippocoleae TaxID=149017 RepID=UPI003342DDFD